MKQFTKHTSWHHLLMIVYCEFINLIWLSVGIAIAIAGWVIFANLNDLFPKLAVGLPLVLIGVSTALFKLNELILVIVRPKRMEVICIFCQNNKLGTADDR